MNVDTQIKKAFELGDAAEVQPLGTGLTNMTFLVQDGASRFVLQGLHKDVPDAAMQDMQIVTEHLSAKGLLTPVLRKTIDGKIFAVDAEGKRWRMYAYHDGRAFDAVPSSAAAFSCGAYLGKTHRALLDLSYTPIGTPPHFHEVPFTVSKVQKDVDLLPEDLQELAQKAVATVPEFYITGAEEQVIHGDPKISNLLFAVEKEEVIGLLDFDTIMLGSRFIDIGDALRSWCNLDREDSIDVTFRMDFFDEIIKGYEYGWGESVDRKEALMAAKLITLELCLRFLHDAARPYFAWDSERFETRADHARARALTQWNLASSIEA